MATILLTGGAGFIGSHCTEALLKRGDKVVCVDNFNNYYDPAIKRHNISQHQKHQNFALYEEDIADADAMRRIFDKENPDKVLHLAARAGVQPSIKDPVEYARSNVLGTTVLLDAANKAGVKDFVFASSSSVYGGNKKVPFSEQDNVSNPYSPYAATKRACELIASTYHRLHGTRIAALRYFTVYGERNRPDMAIYTFAQAITDGKEITLYGEGEDIKRDWTYIADIIAGTLAALDNSEKLGFDIINIGNNTPVPVQRLVELLEHELGKKATIKRAPLPAGDVPITYADTSKAKQLLNWQASTPIEDGVKRFVRWFKEHKSL